MSLPIMNQQLLLTPIGQPNPHIPPRAVPTVNKKLFQIFLQLIQQCVWVHCRAREQTGLALLAVWAHNPMYNMEQNREDEREGWGSGARRERKGMIKEGEAAEVRAETRKHLEVTRWRRENGKKLGVGELCVSESAGKSSNFSVYINVLLFSVWMCQY